MTNKILTVVLLVIAIYCLLKNSKRRQCKYGGENCLLADSDYNRIKTAPPVSCVECGGCVIESGGCCASCNFQTDLTETHCSEHKHSHSHNHQHDHSYQVSGKEIFSLLLMPLIMGVIVYRIVVSSKLNKKNKHLFIKISKQNHP